MSFRLEDVKGQGAALRTITELIAKGTKDPAVVRAARAITAHLPSRDDAAELDAIYDAVKYGTDAVPALKRGLRYVSDPRTVDWYQGAAATLRECAAGACAADCDEHTILVGALAGALGFKVGARAWGPPKAREFTHVYAVVAFPKKGPWTDTDSSVRALDTTVDEYVGWQPPRGRILTYWIED